MIREDSYLKNLADICLSKSKELGSSDVSVLVMNSVSENVNIRNRKIDGQTINGKVPIGIAKIAKKYDKPVICITGSIEPPIENLYKSGITGIFSIQQGPNSKKKSFESSEVLIKNCTERIIDFYMNILKL